MNKIKVAIETVKMNDKWAWEMNYKVKFVESHGGSVEDIHDTNMNKSNVEFIINGAVNSITGGIVGMSATKDHEIFIQEMRIAKKEAFC